MIFPPIVERELRVAARRPATYRARAGAALILLAVWLVLMLGAAMKGRLPSGATLLGFLGWLTLFLSLVSGVLLTADCLSEELREGTLGLLFLTDLQGRDVVSGKLVAHGLSGFFGLLAVFPVLALVLLTGGVSGGEFARTVLVCAATMIGSLGVGLGVSAYPRAGRQPMVRAFGLLLLLATVGPTSHWLIHQARPGFRADWMNLGSPFFAYLCAADVRYRLSGGREVFWWAVGALPGIGALGVLAAMWRLPRIWGEGGEAVRRGRGAEPALRQPRRLIWAGENPCAWLAAREHSAGSSARWILVVLGPIFLGLLAFAIRRPADHIILLGACATALAGHVLIKFRFAMEAGRRLHQDRCNGALELLLATPLAEGEVLDGLWHGLKRQFAMPVGWLCAVNLLLSVVVIVGHRLFDMDAGVLGAFLTAFVGGILALFLDLLALGWLGLWLGLVQARPARAVFQALAWVWLSVWLGTFLAGYLLGPVTDNRIIYSLPIWLAAGGGLSLALAWSARRRLRRDFRSLALAPPAGRG